MTAPAVLAAVAAATAAALAVAPRRVPPPGAQPGAPPGLPPPRRARLPADPTTRGAAPVDRTWPRVVAAVAGGLAVLLLIPGTPGLLLAPAVGAAVWWQSRGWQGAAARRRAARVAADLPHAVDLLVALLAVGVSPVDALDRVAPVVGGPLEEELRPALIRLGLGADPRSVWQGLTRHRELGRLGIALHRATDTGAPVLEALTRLAEELRVARRAEVEARVRQVEVKASVPLAACLLPAFVLLGVVPLVAGAVGGLLLR